MDQSLQNSNTDAVRIEGQLANHPSMRLIAKAIISTTQSMEDRVHFLQQLRTEVPGITPGELYDCAAYFWQGKPFIAITSHHQLAYRISEAADALPLPHHLEHWSPEGKVLKRWRVLVHEEPKDWMLTTLRALELVQGELAGISVPPDGGRKV